MSGDRGERDLQALLAESGGELGRLYRRLPRTEPPRRLDRAILAEAVRAVRGADTRRRPRQRWLLGLGSVAGVVLAAGIAWQVQRERAPAPAPVSQPVAPPGVITVEPIVPPPAEPVPVPPAPAASSAQSAAAPARPAAPARQASPQRAATDPVTVRAERKLEPEPAAAPLPPAETQSKAERADTAADAEPLAERAAAPAAREEAAAEKAARTRAGNVASPAPITSTELRRNMRLPPDRWLDEIRRLRREGQHHWASENLRLFRRVHPRRAIPADLQPLLED